jgi:3-deoxy-D-manno-oct-2-ulosonic acid (Kdo) hydroxylase
MNYLEVVDVPSGHNPVARDECYRAAQALEAGQILFLPRYGFPVPSSYRPLFSPAILDKGSKNVSYNPATGKVGGTVSTGPSFALLQEMMVRFSDFAQEVVTRLLPIYRNGLVRARASFRPVEIEGRRTHWRKDDTRLHVDAFPSSPTQGRRILRLFCNVNPDGRSRVWRLGEPFEQTATRFLPSIKPPLPFSSIAFKLAGITKSRRSAYDHIMLCLHDRMKSDERYQAEAEQNRIEFPAGSTWIVFADQVSHAAIRGQYQLEQTFLLDIDRLHDENTSSLRVLERLTGRKLT